MESENQQKIEKFTTPLQSTSSNNDSTSICDIPRKINLKKQLLKERSIRKLQSKRIKILMQQNRRQKKRSKDLVTLLKNIKNQEMINSEMEQILQENFSNVSGFFKKLFFEKKDRIRKKRNTTKMYDVLQLHFSLREHTIT